MNKSNKLLDEKWAEMHLNGCGRRISELSSIKPLYSIESYKEEEQFKNKNKKDISNNIK